MPKKILTVIAGSLFMATLALAQNYQLNITTGKNKYLHYELVTISARLDSPNVNEANLLEKITARVTRDGKPVTTIGQLKEIPLKYNPSAKAWEGKWPIPWNAPVDTYTVEVDSCSVNNFIPVKCQFEITGRKPPQIKSNLYILTLESTADIKTMRIPSPEGKEGGWEEIIAWAKFIGADTIWYLGGQTAGWKGKVDEEFPWNKSSFAMLPNFAEEVHRNGLKFGVWVAGYLTFGKKEFRPEKYNYAYNYDEKTDKCILTSRTISLSDEKRKQDVINFIKKVSEIPGVDYIGIDYIRNAFGGYEMVDEFIAEMSPNLPQNPSLYSKSGRMKWLAKKVIKREDAILIEQWNWWRAHYVAQNILKDIVDKSNIKQPLWVFTLSWEKGWQHGQDCIMMNDAGVDIDAVMLYEADKWQFDQLIKEWHSYVKAGQVNLIVGNQIDWVVHQTTVNPAGPEEFYNRLVRGATQIYQDSLAKGMFWHDLSRALWGRIGPYSPLEWAVAGGAAFSQLRLKYSLISLSATSTTPEKIKENEIFEVETTVKNLTGKKIQDVNIEMLATPGITCIDENKKIIPYIIVKGENKIIFKLRANDVRKGRDSRYMIATVTKWLENENPERYFSFNYIQISKPEQPEETKKDTKY